MRLKKRRTEGTGTRLLLSVGLGIGLLILAGCAAKAPTGRLEFHPSGNIVKAKTSKTQKEPAGKKANTGRTVKGEYSRKGDELKFNNKYVTVTIKEARKVDNSSNSTIFNMLYDKKFVLLRMSITNRSGRYKVLYDPAITALLDSGLGYSKPLDYPRLYELAMRDNKLEQDLREFRSSFYDLGITVLPLQTITRYIIFRPVTKDAKQARIVIKNIYTGTKVLDLVFPFVLKEAANGRE